MKLLIFVTLLACSIIANAQDKKPIAVYGIGASDLDMDNATAIAKWHARNDAVKKCGGSWAGVVLADNLGWRIEYTGSQPCRPNHYCDPTPTEISATAIFVCKDNLQSSVLE